MPKLKDITAYIKVFDLLQEAPASKEEIKNLIEEIYKEDAARNKPSSMIPDNQGAFGKNKDTQFYGDSETKKSRKKGLFSLTDKVFYRLRDEMNKYLNLDIQYNQNTKKYEMSEKEIKPEQLQLLNHFSSLDFYLNLYTDYSEEVERYIVADGILNLGEKYLSKLMQSLKNQKWIHIKYQTFSSNQIKEHLLAPLLLKQYDHRWYLLAVKEGDPNKTGIKSEDAAILFGLERIKELSITDRKIDKDIFEKLPAYKSFKENRIDKPADIFDHLIGVRFTDETNALKTEVIELQFTKELAPYILSKPFHKSQEIIKNDESGLHIKLYLKVNQELKNLILSYGPGVKVLYPESLKNEIKTALKETLNQYK